MTVMSGSFKMVLSRPGTSGCSQQNRAGPRTSTDLKASFLEFKWSFSKQLFIVCILVMVIPSGYRCQTDVDECVSAPCNNNGTCVDGLNGYYCICATNFTGITCDIAVSIY